MAGARCGPAGAGLRIPGGEERVKDESLPIIQIRNCLLVSIQTELHDRLALGLQESLMERVRSADAKGVILDVSAVEVIDSYITRILNDIGKSVRFMGAECYIVGIRPAVAMTLIEMGVELDSVHTALNLDLALEKLELLQS
jgi:rsbT antagonist protein RsbS